MRLPERIPLIPNDFNFTDVFNKLVHKDKFDEFMAIMESKYYYYDKWKYKAQEWGIKPIQLWGIVKTFRRISNKDLILLNSAQNTLLKFRFGSPSAILRYLHDFDMHLGGIIQGESLIPINDKERYLISSLMEEAIASSQLEGAATTRKVAKEMLENNRRPTNHSEQMILNNYEGMKWIVRHKDAPITIERIKELHALLTRSTLPDTAEVGAFRKDDEVKVIDVQTGNPVYTPPKAEVLDQLMEAYCNFANSKNKDAVFLHPICKSITLHFLIGYIHPFADGNGRTARSIFYWFLLKNGYWLIEFMSVSRIILNSKAQYSRAYLHTEQDENDLNYFLLYNLRAMDLALKELKLYIGRKTAEKNNAIALLRNTDLNDRQILIVQEILQDTSVYFTAVQHQNRFGISNQTARNDLQGLVDRGYLEIRLSGNKRQYLPVKGVQKKVLKSSSK